VDLRTNVTDPGGVAAYVAGVRHALAASYAVEQKEFGGRTVDVGHRSDFRLRWGAVRLFTTVSIAPFGADAGTAALDEYLDACRRAARAAAGRAPLGLQAGAAAVAVAVLPALGPEARAWASRPHGHRFASVGYPVAVGVSTREVVEPERMVTGRVFRGFLRGVVAELLAAPYAG
jgi:hypothetical protein